MAILYAKTVDGKLEVTEPVVNEVTLQQINREIAFLQAQRNNINARIAEKQILLTKCTELGVII